MNKNEKKEYQVSVRVIEARGLAGVNTGRNANALCVVQIGPVSSLSKTTETKEKTVYCHWDANFLFDSVWLSDADFVKEKLVFKVFDRNSFVRNQLIGQYEFSLGNIYRQKNHEYYKKWVPLALPDQPSKNMGSLLVSVYVVGQKDYPPNHESKDDTKETDEVLLEPHLLDRKPYILNVLIYRGAHILASHAYVGALNPFVSVRFNGNTIQTSPMTNTSDPVWNRKMEMPFHIPLSSDSIEIQLWNNQKGRPDVIIGQQTFSYFNMRLTHKSWGPEWVNLYSSNYVSTETSVVGYIKDRISGVAESKTDSEYVGRILVRLSVTPRDFKPPRLLNGPANPTAEPEGMDFSLYFMLHSGSEIPVLGGQVRVEIAFGSIRKSSKWVHGHSGVFVWNNLFEVIRLYCPVDLKQIHDIIINVYHRAGMSSRKIAFERISVESLLMGHNKHSILNYSPNNQLPIFFVNGEHRLKDKNAWKPRWRTLKHVHHDIQHPHVVAGFLLCSIGFGLTKCEPPTPPALITPRLQQYVLRAYIHQAANLLSAKEDGTSNPFLVIRFGGVYKRLGTIQGTLFPFWYQCVDLDPHLIDLENPPSIYLMMYHEDSFDHTLMGRCEILAEHALDNKNNKLYRYRLRYDSQLYADREIEEVSDTDPYVLASFQLFPHDDRDPRRKSEWDNTGTSSTKSIVSTSQPMKEYQLKIECIGIRQVNINGTSHISNPCLDVEIPNINRFAKDSQSETNDGPHTHRFRAGSCQGNSYQILESYKFERILLPVHNLSGVPMYLKLIDNRATGDVVLGQCTCAISDFIDGHIEKPPFYRYNAKKKPEETLKDDEPEKRTMGINMRGDEKMEEKKMDEETEEKDEALDLDVNEDELNVTLVKDSGPYLSLNEQKANEADAKAKAAKSDEIKGEVEERPENILKHTPFHVFPLKRGKNVGIEYLDRQIFGREPNTSISISAKLKAFVRVFPAEYDSKLEEKDFLDKIKPIYDEKYIARVYIYKAVNLSPHDESLMSSHQSSDPYLVISNGNGPNHSFNERMNHQNDTLNPEFYQIFELKTVLPENNDLEITLWDYDDYFSDDLIGTTMIDLEWRLLNNLAAAGQEYRKLTNATALTPQGKVHMRLELLTEDQARKIKAEEIRPEGLLSAYMGDAPTYELRLVIWNTRDVKLPEDQNRNKEVDQKICVTTNFEGKYNSDTIKHTDTAWYALSGAAEWNYRMIYKLQLPCRVPRMKFSIWDANVVSDDDLVGEVIYNLAPFFERVLRDKKVMTHQPQRWLQFTHSNFPGSKLGEVCVELWCYTVAEAELYPCGEAQSEPNQHPYLPDPQRNPPPWAIGSQTLNWISRRKALTAIICLALLLLPILVPVVFTLIQKILEK